MVTDNHCCYTALTIRLLTIWPHAHVYLLTIIVKLGVISHSYRYVTDGEQGKKPKVNYIFFIKSISSLKLSISCYFKVIPHLIIMNQFTFLVQLNEGLLA